MWLAVAINLNEKSFSSESECSKLEISYGALSVWLAGSAEEMECNIERYPTGPNVWLAAAINLKEMSFTCKNGVQ